MSTAPPPSFPAPDYDPRPHAAAIREPAAVVLLCDADHERAHVAVAAFEQELFPPGTPANDLYQVVNDWAWEGILLAVAVFPGEHLPRLRAIVEARGMYLLDGTPKTVVQGKVSAYDVNALLRRTLGVEAREVRVVHGAPEFYVPSVVSTV